MSLWNVLDETLNKHVLHDTYYLYLFHQKRNIIKKIYTNKVFLIYEFYTTLPSKNKEAVVVKKRKKKNKEAVTGKYSSL